MQDTTIMEKDLDSLIRRGESETVEFKSSAANIGETICAFANSNGGILIIGIDDKGKLLGVGKGEEEKTFSTAQSCEPKVKIYVSKRVTRDKHILIVHLRKSNTVHFFKGRAYVRLGPTNRVLAPIELAQIFRKRDMLIFDNTTNEKAALEDINWDFVESKLKELETNELKIKTDKKELLENIGCISDDQPTNAGLLLFGKNPQKFFPFAYITVVKYTGESVSDYYEDFREFGGNLFEQIDSVSSYLEGQNNKLGIITDKPIRREISKYPPYALRELIVNAVAHRDYTVPDRIIIKIYSDKIEYHSPGSLPDGVTIESILTKHKTRNPIIY